MRAFVAETLLTPSGVANWVKYAVQLPEHAKAFEDNKINWLDFSVLMQVSYDTHTHTHTHTHAHTFTHAPPPHAHNPFAALFLEPRIAGFLHSISKVGPKFNTEYSGSHPTRQPSKLITSRAADECLALKHRMTAKRLKPTLESRVSCTDKN